MLILGLIFFSAITTFVTLSCSSGSDSSMAGLILMSGENNGTSTPTPAPVPTPEPNEPKPEPAPDPEPEPTPTPAPNEPEPTPDPNPTYVKVAELTRNDYDTSHDAQKEICGIQAKIPLRKALSDFPGMQVNDTYTVTLTGKASREFTAQILFYDDTESGNYSGLSKWGENVTFGTSFSITKDIVLEKLPTSGAVSPKAWDVEKSFSLMIDVPAGVSATADIPPATLSFTEFKVEKKSGGVITNWTLVNDFNSETIASGWEKADWTNGDMFNCWWDPENITFNESGNSLMKMKICQNSNPSHKLDGNIMDYNGSELRTTGTYGYGYYEVRMKPCKASGTNSSFFLYTKDDGNNIEWNEVDIEFITKDMGDGRGLRSIPQFNFFIDNAGQGHEFLYTDLEFDASTAFHVYGIEYAADHISWYVDGKKVYTATGCEEGDHNHAQGSLPRHNMQIMVNFWPGTGVDDWLGHFNYSAPLYAEYDYIKFKAAE